MERIETGDEDLYKFSKAYNTFGIHINDDNSVTALEWAPGAQELFLTGDFSKKKKITSFFSIRKICESKFAHGFPKSFIHAEGKVELSYLIFFCYSPIYL